MKSIYLSIIIPVFNESERLINIKKIVSYLKKQKYTSEIIVINDGSTDSTFKILQKLRTQYQFTIISYAPNKGKGYAIKKGMLQAKGLHRVFIDIDLSTPINVISKALPCIQSSPVVIASRRLPGSTIVVHQSIFRENMGKLFTKISQFLTGVTVSDFTCGFKCFSKEAAEQIFFHTITNRWGIDSEVLFLAQKYHFTIKEIPVVWENDMRSKVKFPQDIINSFSELLLIRFYDLLKKYD